MFYNLILSRFQGFYNPILSRFQGLHSKKNERKLQDKYTYANYYVEDSNGNRKSLIDADGAAMYVQSGTNWSAEINNFEMNSDYIKMIPYTIDYDSATGKEIPGTEVIDEEHAFIIRLK